MAKTIQKANTPPSESTEFRTAGPSATGALNGEHESEAACQSNGQPTDSDEETIRALAHSKWEAAGCPAGDGIDFWLQPNAKSVRSSRVRTPRRDRNQPQHR